ncbi:hypothetical protein ID866_8643, partial [Astraeus odoratus]
DETQDTSKDIASLILLALSDYRIWSDADLRRKLDTSLEDDDATTSGFVPVNYLIRRPPFRGSLSIQPSEVDVVKAIRSFASESLEVRMLASVPSSSVWYGPGKTSRKKDVGGYEVRRRDWATLLAHPFRGLTAVQWDDRTLYMECVPTRYRSIAGLAQFTAALLQLLSPPPSSLIRIQNVTLPPHYLDSESSIPKCRGYALITVSTVEERNFLLEKWPWHRQLANAEKHEPSEIKEAKKFGLRTIRKTQWNELNKEYIAYRQELAEEAFKFNERMNVSQLNFCAGTGSSTRVQSKDEGSLTLAADISAEPAALQTILSSPYPFGCLVFVRNVHPETNKTTLKTLFSRPFAGPGQYHGLDYVDFNKGMDSCHLRLASPHHTTLLMEYFLRHPTVQAHGLDDAGRRPGQHDKGIKMEIIEGKREELYWDKVPDKVRRQAVERVVQSQWSVRSDTAVFFDDVPTVQEIKKRKR